MVETSGATLLAALENAVCKWPQTEGRFCQVSGIKFAFDPSKPPGERVDRDSVLIVARHGSRVAAARTPTAALSPLAVRSRAEEAASASPPSGVNSDEDLLRDADDVPVSTSHGGGAAASLRDVVAPPTSDVSSPAFFLQVTSPISENAHSMPVSPVHPAQGCLLPSGLRPSILRTHSMPGEISAAHALHITSPPGSSGGSGSSSRVAWKPLVLTKRYRVALKHYILQGKDGFTMLIPDQPGNDVRVLIDDHTGPVLPSLLRAHFKVLTAYTDGDVGSSLGDLERSNGIPLIPATPLSFSSAMSPQPHADSARVEAGVAGLAASPRVGLRISGLVRVQLDGGKVVGNSDDSPSVSSSPALSTIASAMSSVTLSDELDTLTAARGDVGPEHVRDGIATATPLGFGRTGEETASSIAALAANIRLDAPTPTEQHVNDYLKLNAAIGSPLLVNSESLANTGMAAVRIPLRLGESESAPGILTTRASGTALRPFEPAYASTLTAIPFSAQGVSRAISAAQDAESALSPAPKQSAPRSINASFSAAPKLDRVSAFLSADSEGDGAGSVPRTPHLSHAPRQSYTVGAKSSRVGSDGLKTASALAIAPCIEGRITVIGFEHLARAAEAEATAYGRSHLGGQ